MKRFYFAIFCCCQIGWAQVGINTTLPKAQLDIRSSNQAAPANTDGLLIPKIDTFPATNPTVSQQGMLVYLTTTSGSNTPGFYYWNNPTTAWVAVGAGNDWSLSGNSGTDPATQFIGTTDNKDLIFKRAGSIAGKLGASNTFFGASSGSVATGNNNTYMGTEAGLANTSGQQNVFLGRRAGAFGATGSDNVFIGNGAGLTNTANQNNFVGAFAGNVNTTGANNTFFGYSSGSLSNGMRNTFVGAFAGDTNTTGADNTLIGNSSSVGFGTLTNATAIGSNARVSASNALVLGSINGVNSATASTSVGIGTTIPKGALDVTSTNNGILIPRVSLTGSGSQAPVVDPQGGTLQTSTLVYNTATTSDVYPGFYYWSGSKWTRFDVDGENNPKYYTVTGTTSVGIPSTYTLAPQMEITFTPQDDVVVVNFSANGFSSSTSCSEAPVFFRLMLNGVAITGWQTTAEVPSGVSTVRPIWNCAVNIPLSVTIGTPQTISIYWATNCASMGHLVANPTSAASGLVYQANRCLTVIDPNGGGGIVGTAPVTTNMWALNGNAGINPSSQFLGTVDAQSLILKSNNNEGLRVSTNGYVYMPSRLGMGTFSPVATLDVVGSIRMNDGTQGAGKVMTSDGNGIGGWETLTDSAWGISGNAGTNPSTDFVGTTDAKPLVLRTNNTEWMRLTDTGDLGIGTTTPAASLEVRKTSPTFRIAADDANSSFLQLYEMTSGSPFGYQFQYDGATDKLHLWSKGFAGNDAVRMSWLKDGNVGVGTANPLTRFEIHDDNKVTAAATRGNLHLMATNAQAIDIGGSLTLGGYYDNTATTVRVFASVEGRKANSTNTSSSGYLQFKTNNTGTLLERMRITNAGDVGIGTTTPGGLFELSLDEGRKPGTTTWTVTSDARLKTIEGNYTKGLAEITQLNPVRYRYKDFGGRKFDPEVLNTEFSGFVAQEVQPLFPEAVKADEDGFLSLNIHPILMASINALKELEAKNTQLQQENESLKAQLQNLSAKVDSILAEMGKAKK